MYRVTFAHGVRRFAESMVHAAKMAGMRIDPSAAPGVEQFFSALEKVRLLS